MMTAEAASRDTVLLGWIGGIRVYRKAAEALKSQ